MTAKGTEVIDAPMKILVVEDDPAHAEAIRRAFVAAGARATIETVATLREYHAAARAEAPDIALLDLNLPDGRAVEALAGSDLAFPVLIMTSFGDEHVAVEAMRAGAIDYVVKSPEAFAGMPRTVDRALREWALLEDRRRANARIVHLNSVLRGVRAVNRLITREKDPDLLLADACNRLVETMGYRSVWVALRAEDGAVRLAAHAGIPPDVVAKLEERLAGGDPPEPARSALRRPGIAVESLSADASPESGLDEPAAECAALSARMELDGKVHGVVSAAVAEPFARDGEVQALFLELVGDLAFALYRVDLERAHEAGVEALALSEARYRDLVEGIDEVVLSADPEGRVLYVSPAVERIFGFLPDRLTGHDFREFVHPEDRLGLERALARALEGISEPHEFRGLDASGRVRYLRMTVRAQLNGSRPTAVRGVIIDQTERHEATLVREGLEGQLRVAQRLEAIGRLAGGIAHDFNNLLSVILGYTGIALGQLSPDDPGRRHLLEVRKAGSRAADLIRQLLAFGRKQPLEPRAIDLNAIVADLDSLLRRLLGEDVAIALRLAKGLRAARADAAQVEQVVMNLAVNARDAMPGGGTLTIETDDVLLDDDYASLHVGVRPGPYVRLTVSDTGTGMDADTVAHAFDPFFTTKEEGKGTGLGLATVYGIVKQSGGNVWIYSEPGHGTTFKVYLPRSDASPTAAEETPPAVAAARGETILLVEDDDAVRGVAQYVLQGAGYRVLSAAGWRDAEGLARAHGTEIALLMTDVVMPEVGGRELAERLKRGLPKLRVLFTSGYTEEAALHHGVLDPGAKLLSKPYTASSLTRRVREVLDEG